MNHNNKQHSIIESNQPLLAEWSEESEMEKKREGEETHISV